MIEPRFVTVRWHDAWADGVDDVTHETVGDKHRPILMETRGWLMVDNEVGVSLFYERCLDPQTYRGRTFIPRGMVVAITDFPTVKVRRRPRPTPPVPDP